MARHHYRRLAATIGENVAVAPTPERRNHGVVERLERPIARHARGNGASRFDHTPDASSGRGFPGMLRDRSARSVARPRLVATKSRQLVEIANCRRAGLANRSGARRGLARHFGGRWHQLARRLMPVACRRLGTVVEGMGARAGLERPSGQPRGGVGNPDRGARGARGVFRHQWLRS